MRFCARSIAFAFAFTAAGGVHAQPVVRIGHVGPVSGPNSHLGKDNENAARMAIAPAEFHDYLRALMRIGLGGRLMFGSDWEVNASAGVRYIGEKLDTSQTLATPDVTLVDAALRVARGPWEMSVTGSNILNKRYYDFCSVSAPGNSYCIAAKDRTIIAGLTRRF